MAARLILRGGHTVLGNLLTTLTRDTRRASRARRVVSLLQEARELAERGELRAAVARCEEALRIDDTNAAAYLQLGNVCRVSGDWQRAEENYRRALDLNPADARAHYSLALALRRRGVEAIEHLERAAADPELLEETIRIRVSALADLGRLAEAVAAARAAADLLPDSAACAAALGLAHHRLTEPHIALEAYDRAVELGADDPELHSLRGGVLQELGRLPEALESYGRALERDPQYGLARFHRALCRLLMADYAGGWPDYEARLLSREYRGAPHLPKWDGREAGRRLLVRAEQGLGDQIMFASCLPDLLSVAGECVVECDAKLRTLFSRSFPAARVVSAPISPADALRAADAEIPLGSLPRLYRRSRDAFPRHSGYLQASPTRVEFWKLWLGRLGTGLKIGVSWRGGTARSRAAARSVALSDLDPIFATSGVHFVSLQYGAETAREIDDFNATSASPITHEAAAIADYDETAALVSALDLTITVCTSIVHLSGALGRPVWVLAPFSPEWRYGASGDQMHWYPAARVYRQPAYGAWGPVIAEVTTALRERVAGYAC